MSGSVGDEPDQSHRAAGVRQVRDRERRSVMRTGPEDAVMIGNGGIGGRIGMDGKEERFTTEGQKKAREEGKRRMNTETQRH